MKNILIEKIKKSDSNLISILILIINIYDSKIIKNDFKRRDFNSKKEFYQKKISFWINFYIYNLKSDSKESKIQKKIDRLKRELENEKMNKISKSSKS